MKLTKKIKLPDGREIPAGQNVPNWLVAVCGMPDDEQPTPAYLPEPDKPKKKPKEEPSP